MWVYYFTDAGFVEYYLSIAITLGCIIIWAKTDEILIVGQFVLLKWKRKFVTKNNSFLKKY